MLKKRKIKNGFEHTKKTFIFEIEDFFGIQRHIPILAEGYEQAVEILLKTENLEFDLGDLKRFDCLMPT